MIYINEEQLLSMGFEWTETIQIIEKAVQCLGNDQYVQPLKPYLRFKDLKNRIIAMPAYIGGDFELAGIKWISSFPNNLTKGIPRAHSVVIINNADTGMPQAIINTALLSALRTASVSGLVLKKYMQVRKLDKAKVGVIGAGPIGRLHIEMIADQLGDKLNHIAVYDIRPVNLASFPVSIQGKIRIVNSWEEAYEGADVFVTCTVSSESYIDKAPKPGSLQMNVSLRDYKPDVYEYVKNAIIVDNWDEICRENTDIENLHLKKGLARMDVKTIIDVVMSNAIENFDTNDPVFFNPMGMAVFDIAMGSYFYNKVMKDETLKVKLSV